MIDYRENNIWSVYIHISPSNKYYVGITSQNPISARWRNGKGYKYNTHFWRAIQKYEWDNFEHEIFAEHLTKDEACEMEKTLIRELESNDAKHGYNICSGGEGTTGLYGEKNPNFNHHWTEEQRKRMSEYFKLHPRKFSEEGQKHKSDLMKIKWQDPEYRKNNSGENAPCCGRTGEKHPLFGVPSVCRKRVICLNTMEVFTSATEASKIKNANHSKLCMCCRGERKSCGRDENNNPLHWQYLTDYIKQNNLTLDEAQKSLFFIT